MSGYVADVDTFPELSENDAHTAHVVVVKHLLQLVMLQMGAHFNPKNPGEHAPQTVEL
jgi:hypothetical protein